MTKLWLAWIRLNNQITLQSNHWFWHWSYVLLCPHCFIWRWCRYLWYGKSLKIRGWNNKFLNVTCFKGDSISSQEINKGKSRGTCWVTEICFCENTRRRHQRNYVPWLEDSWLLSLVDFEQREFKLC